jgi:hypothetical protein
MHVHDTEFPVGRAECRDHGARYVQGSLLDGEREPIEPLAELVSGGNVQMNGGKSPK